MNGSEIAYFEVLTVDKNGGTYSSTQRHKDNVISRSHCAALQTLEQYGLRLVIKTIKGGEATNKNDTRNGGARDTLKSQRKSQRKGEEVEAIIIFRIRQKKTLEEKLRNKHIMVLSLCDCRSPRQDPEADWQQSWTAWRQLQPRLYPGCYMALHAQKFIHLYNSSELKEIRHMRREQRVGLMSNRHRTYKDTYLREHDVAEMKDGRQHMKHHVCGRRIHAKGCHRLPQDGVLLGIANTFNGRLPSLLCKQRIGDEDQKLGEEIRLVVMLD